MFGVIENASKANFHNLYFATIVPARTLQGHCVVAMYVVNCGWIFYDAEENIIFNERILESGVPENITIYDFDPGKNSILRWSNDGNAAALSPLPIRAFIETANGAIKTNWVNATASARA